MEKKIELYFFLDIKFNDDHIRVTNMAATEPVTLDGEQYQPVGGSMIIEPRHENAEHLDIEFGSIEQSLVVMARDFCKGKTCNFILHIAHVENGAVVHGETLLKDHICFAEFRLPFMDPQKPGRILLKNYDPEEYQRNVPPFDLGIGGLGGE